MFCSPDADQLTAALVAIERRQRELDLERAQLIAVWDEQRAWAVDGSATPAARLARETGLSGQQARERVRISRRLRDVMPHTLAAFEELGWPKVRLLANAIDERTRASFMAHEELLVENARRFTVDQLALFLGHWRRLVDADGANRNADAMHDEQFLHIAQSWDGEGFVNGRLDPEATAVVKAALEAIGEEIYRNEARQRTLAKLRGEDAGPLMSAAHRDAIALAEMARRAMSNTAAAAAGAPVAPARPTVHVVIDADDEGAIRSRYASGAPMPDEDASRHACDATVARVVTKDGTVPLYLGRTVREPSEAQRRALSALWSSCVFPGCDRPFSWTHLHHVEWWTHGGRTDVDKLVPTCNHHHAEIHKGTFTIHRRPNGTYWFQRADGAYIGEANPTVNRLLWTMVRLDLAAA